MDIKKKTAVLALITTLFAGLFLTESIGITSFLKMSASKNTQEECKRLSKETGIRQIPMTGHVLKSQFSLQSVVDCDSAKGDCSKYRNRGITAIMRPINNSSNEEFIVYTKKEPPEILNSKKPYFTVGKNYEFCATDLEKSTENHRARHHYKIHDVNSIREIHELDSHDLSKESQNDEIQEAALAELEAKCQELTSTNDEGHVYETITGQMIHKKTYWRIIPSRDPSEFTSFIAFLNNNQETLVRSIMMTDKNLIENYKKILDNVIYNHKDKPNFNSYIYGICAYKDDEDNYKDQINTLTLIKGGEVSDTRPNVEAKDLRKTIEKLQSK